ncbi:unnamed protein product [Bursaphelenchus okinawaensis]|uniref:Core Histone H2A/H2B/H3 domain-containing protein n=1 Tax=Bursaphelenchus okinawaensis TaxID=465554 RepID=A0A811JRC8_9BILA|nr:unnamed protein product [Bursaphelenchus okinawaensis]CAG9079406.1 unnamed protein product [Bursaphelenchus okinawaensis]
MVAKKTQNQKSTSIVRSAESWTSSASSGGKTKRKEVAKKTQNQQKSLLKSPEIVKFKDGYKAGGKKKIVLKTKEVSKRGTNVLKEIRRLQSSVHNVIPRAPFMRLVQSVTRDLGKFDFKFRVESIFALQEATEMFLCELMEDSNMLAFHAKRVTMMRKDLLMALRIRGAGNR